MDGGCANKNPCMLNISSLLLGLALAAAPAFAQRDLGVVDVNGGGKTLPVRVSADSGELNTLAQRAFGSHGRYHVVASGFLYDIRFSLVSPTSVRVDISRPGGGVISSELVPGANARNALLRAADVAVEKTNGLGLKGYFASKLVFIGQATGHDEVYTGDLFFGNVRRMTSDRAFALSPRWSPDGGRVLYTSYYHHGFPDVFLMNFADNQRTTFESFKGTNSGARFSPDGEHVAMVLSGEGTTEIYLSDAQGRRVTRLTRRDSVKSSPCFSPDGSRIVFASGEGSHPQLYVMSAQGGGMQRISFGLSSYCAEPDWSRGNPNRIAYTIGVGANHYQTAVLDFSKHESVQVSKAPFDAIEPCWLPDGRHLVYTARDRTHSILAILDSETGKSTQISPVSFGPALHADVWPR